MAWLMCCISVCVNVQIMCKLKTCGWSFVKSCRLIAFKTGRTDFFWGGQDEDDDPGHVLTWIAMLGYFSLCTFNQHLLNQQVLQHEY